MLKVDTIIENGQTTIQLNGMLDSNNASQLEEAVNKVSDNDIKNVCIDLQNLEYTSSKGLRIILSLQKRLDAKNGKLVLKNIQPAVKEVFEVTGFTDFMDIQ